MRTSSGTWKEIILREREREREQGQSNYQGDNIGASLIFMHCFYLEWKYQIMEKVVPDPIVHL